MCSSSPGATSRSSWTPTATGCRCARAAERPRSAIAGKAPGDPARRRDRAPRVGRAGLAGPRVDEDLAHKAADEERHVVEAVVGAIAGMAHGADVTGDRVPLLRALVV